MAEHYGEGDRGIDAQGSSEASEQAQEQFRENLKKSQAATKQAKQEEGVARAYDDGLAQILSQLLQQGNNHTMINLIAELIEKNIPSDFILSVLSLQFSTITFASASTGIQPNSQSTALLYLSNSSSFQPAIQTWTNNMLYCAKKDAERVMETIIETSTWQLRGSLISLAAHILQNTAKDHNEEIDFQDAKATMQKFFENLLQNLQNNIN